MFVRLILGPRFILGAETYDLIDTVLTVHNTEYTKCWDCVGSNATRWPCYGTCFIFRSTFYSSVSIVSRLQAGLGLDSRQ